MLLKEFREKLLLKINEINDNKKSNLFREKYNKRKFLTQAGAWQHVFDMVINEAKELNWRITGKYEYDLNRIASDRLSYVFYCEYIYSQPCMISMIKWIDDK
jgi:hypothetical protein